ncbi:terpenoid synthase [Trichocladium antarcticum]|uniref:Terpene synthase n=1 Tax=Trichocladium antarcticum TaxID=1450529 RepID=A0AAN6UKU1_9PEZI|nr:terpenoid synthase [Trichocladium antarcticum]
MELGNPEKTPSPPLKALHGQRLVIPDLRPVFAAWKQGINPLHGRVKLAVEARLARLIEDKRVLEKLTAVDIGLFAAGWFPDAPYDVLETVAVYCVWTFLWDDAIDGAAMPADGSGDGLPAAEQYCRESLAFVRYHLGLGEPGVPEPAAPTAVCEIFAEVGRRVSKYGGLAEKRVFFEHIKEYMDACVLEYKWRLSGKMPSVGEFFSWRLITFSAYMMLDLTRILSRISLPRDILESNELTAMSLSINKLLIIVNELFSLKKELGEGAIANLIPVTMRALGASLESATRSVIQDISDCIESFDKNALAIRAKAAMHHAPGVENQILQLTKAYQALATTNLNFSIQTPRYGLLEGRQQDGSFVVGL